MSHQERRIIVSLLTGIAILTAYGLNAFGRYQTGALPASDLKGWATTMLIFIGIGIVASIVIQIIFHILSAIGIAITKKIEDGTTDDMQIERTIDLEMKEDEMDRLIELKAMRVGFFFAGIGFVAGLVALAVGAPPALMLNILFVSFSLGALLEGVTQLYFYRRGVAHG
jgi:hypothetical protein